MDNNQFTAGIYQQQYEYKSFLPTKINTPFNWNNSEIDILLSDANRLLGELNAYSQLIPDIDFYIRMHVVKEATNSSRIEGSRTKINEAVLPESEILPERRDDWQEVQNYVNAMNFAIENLNALPLSMRLLRQTREILMSGVRGQDRLPGEIRKSQNWIGGSSLKDAVFIPPTHEELPDLITDLERYMHNEELAIPHLIRIAFSHYQFETIHPFLDGNGRIGRLLITLYLIDKNLLAQPTLYLSDFLERNRGSYYDALTAVRISNDINHWLKFFLVGIVETAKSGIETFHRIVEVRHSAEEKIMSLGRRVTDGSILLTHLYSNPIVSVANVADLIGKTHQTANSLVKHLDQAGILKEITGYQRNRLFVFEEYMSIFVDYRE